ncbi:hypothetical protein VNO78_08685 [Psophocarpus tetragonolobus]|uniref:Uncharacterized protein n=1 Tax=Psophocarpus tetragonolobus TaxID=3891 RepID=A0AAN9SYD9_PSOTE
MPNVGLGAIEDLRIEYLIHPLGTVEEEEASSDFELEENGEEDEDVDGEDGKKSRFCQKGRDRVKIIQMTMMSVKMMRSPLNKVITSAPA